MKPFMFKHPLLILMVLGLSCQPVTKPDWSESAILFRNVQVLDVESGTISEIRHMVIDSGYIRQILSQAPDTTGFETILDGDGAIVMPGLTEMHAHIPSPPASENSIEETLFLYLSNGITTIRGMLGHPYHLELREKVLEGRVLGPRIYTSSPSMNGNTVPDPATAIQKVQQYAAEGYDFLKIHPGIRRVVFDSLAATARKEGIAYAGHVPVEVGIRHALENGYATIDHVDGYLEGLVPEVAGVRPSDNGFFGFNFTDLADTTQIGDLMELTRKNQVWVVPTQSLFDRWFAPTSADSLLAQDEMKYMQPETLSNWKRVKEQYMADPSWDPGKWERFDAIRLELIRRLYRDGQGLLLGSDAPQLFNVPGFSIHHEIDGMQRAGIPNTEILRMATLYPARFFGIENEVGSIEEGKRAEFILVAENPLENPDALKGLKGVMLNGQWISRETIDTRLATIAASR